MQPNEKYGHLADSPTIEKTAAFLRQNNIEVFITEKGEEAKKKVLELVPEGAEVMTMSSATLQELGLVQEFNESGRFNSVKKKLMAMDRATQGSEMRRLGASPGWAIGSVNAITEDGHLFIASNGGSQLPAYAHATGHVVWVVGAQKIVPNFEEAMKRLYEYCLPLEDERAQKAYGIHSGVSKILIVNKEVVPGRLTVIFVKEQLGF